MVEHGRSESATSRRAASVEWVRQILGLILAALVAYFTAIGSIRVEVAAVKATEQSHFDEVLRSLQRIESDVRELRARHP